MTLLLGDCLEKLKEMPDNSVDSIITDPPYGISFMNKKWDHSVPSIEVWQECLRVLKPGGHMLVACGTRTQHRMVTPIEDAGFEIRDVITWLYGSGFPKSHDISKAIDREAGAEREVIGSKLGLPGYSEKNGVVGYERMRDQENTFSKDQFAITAPATDAAKQWEGFGTALKPACEFWTLCRKPLSEKTIAKNVLKHGVGGLNIDACRVGIPSGDKCIGGAKSANGKGETVDFKGLRGYDGTQKENTTGRFPANLILDESAAAELDEQSGANNSRFFYCAKASASEKGAGLGEDKNVHPTVKPVKLMEYLCRLITPPFGVVLDPFMGSGSTGVGAMNEGFGFIGIEMTKEYFDIACARIDAATLGDIAI